MAGPAVVTLGPANTETRYVVEDVPFGLLPIAVLGAIAGVETPFHAMGLRLFSASTAEISLPRTTLCRNSDCTI